MQRVCQMSASVRLVCFQGACHFYFKGKVFSFFVYKSLLSIIEMSHTVIATMKFKSAEDFQACKEILVTPNGLTKTRTSEGCQSIRCYEGEENTLVIYQQWDSKEDHSKYLKMRMEEGLLGKIKETLREEMSIVHLKTLRV